MTSISIHIPAPLLQLRPDFQDALTRAAQQGELVLAAYTARSLRTRWYRTGHSLASFTSEAEVSRAAARAIVRSGTSYDAFGEYGTGRRGAASPVEDRPAGWRYGRVAGMAPRRQFVTALEQASPALQVAVDRAMEAFITNG